jgi:hypothetical protein
MMFVVRWSDDIFCAKAFCLDPNDFLLKSQYLNPLHSQPGAYAKSLL